MTPSPNPPLTVVMPTYNGAAFLRPQIESILAQSRSDFELLTVDDGSDDGTAAIVDEYARRDRRVSRLPSTGNVGQRGRLRQLCQAAPTEFLAIADQDDLWHPERNARLLDAIGDRAVALGRSQLTDAQGRDLGRSILEEFGFRPDVGPLQALFQPLVSAHAAIVRRSWLDVAAFHGSIEFDRAIGLEALFSTGLAYVDDAVVFHRIHGSNQNNASALDKEPRRRLVSRQRARLSLSFVGMERFDFHRTLEQLGRSAALAPAVSRMFRDLARACHNAWYYPYDREGARRDRLERGLLEALGPYAASDADLLAFRRRVRSLTRSQYGLTNLRRAATRYVRE